MIIIIIIISTIIIITIIIIIIIIIEWFSIEYHKTKTKVITVINQQYSEPIKTQSN